MRKDEVGFLRPKKLRASGVWLLLLAGALGILLLTIGGIGIGGEEEQEKTEVYEEKNGSELLDAYIDALESKIAALCERVDGVSDVRVVVTLSSGYEYVYAKDAEIDASGENVTGSYHYLTVGSGSSEKVVYLSEKQPTVGGIGIVCRGGGDPSVRRELIELLGAAFAVPSNKIYIAEGG